LTNATNGATTTQTVTISSEDVQPTVTLSVPVSTLDEATGATTTVTVNFTPASGLDVTVVLAKSGTASFGVDYTLGTSTLVVPAGATSAQTVLTILDDNLNEVLGGETIVIDVDTVTNGTETGTQTKTITITGDDSLPTVTLSVGSPTIGESGASATTTVTATLSVPASGLPVTVTLTKSSNSALETTDYTLNSSITIPAGSQSAFITLAAAHDTLDENPETVTVTMNCGAGSNCTNGSTLQQTVTINDDDALPTVSLQASPSALAETNGSTSAITASLNTASGLDVTVTLAKNVISTATEGVDYTLGNTIVIQAGQLDSSINLLVIGDTKFEINETVKIDIASVSNGLEDGVQDATVTINNDDAAPSVTLGVSVLNINEAGGTAVVTANLSNPSGADVVVTLTTVGSTATSTEYTLATTITVPADANFASVTLTATDDALDENDETVAIDISGVTNGTKGLFATPTVTITDDDALPTVTLAATGTIIENGGTTTVTAIVTPASGRAITVTLGKAGTAINSTDYTLAPTIVIPAGATSTSVVLTASQDPLDEDDNETVILTVSDAGGFANFDATSKTVNIADDDLPSNVTLSVGEVSFSIPETGGTTTVIATLNVVSGRDVIVSLGKGGTATNAVDYTLDDTITITAGATSTSITLSAVGDTISEGTGETVLIEIAGVTNGTENGTQQHTVTITDDDIAPVVTLTVGSNTVTEGSGSGGSTLVTATLDKTSSQTVTVSLTKGGNATSGTDYAIASTISITPGNTTGVATLNLTGDFLDETNETVVLTIGSVTTNNATIGTSSSQTVTITDDDASPSVTLSVGTATISEVTGTNATTTTVTATLSASSGQSVTVTLSKTGSTATEGAGSDYTLASVITIPAGSGSASVILAALNDPTPENNETVVITITGVTNGTTTATQTQTVTIESEDVPAVPTMSAIVYNVKKFTFSWTASAGATTYELFEAQDGTTFTKVSTVTGTTADLEVAAHIHNWPAAKYKVRACVSGTICSADSGLVNTSVAGAMLEATGYLKASVVGNDNNHGYSVSVSGDGNTVAVGVPGDGQIALGSGAVVIYKKNTLGVWSVEHGALKASNAGGNDHFGTAVALSDDGNSLVVGAPDEDGDATSTATTSNDNATSAGAAYVFTRTNAIWSQISYVKASNASTGDLFGSSVAISGDGTRFVVGAPLEDTTTTTSGAAYMFTFSGTIATQETTPPLKAASPTSNVDFGRSVALDQTGVTLAVGAPDEATGGKVSVFKRTDVTWSTLTTITGVVPAATAADDTFGESVSLSDDGSILAVGAPYTDSTATNTGSVYVFTGAGFETQQPVLKASNAGAEDRFGSSVSLSNNGNTLIVGAPGEDSGTVSVPVCTSGSCNSDDAAFNSGAAYRFAGTAGVFGQQAYIKATNVGAGDNFGFSLSVSDAETITTNTTSTQTLVIGAPFEGGSIVNSSVEKGNVTTNNDVPNAGAAYLH
jgi:hypothetical protein